MTEPSLPFKDIIAVFYISVISLLAAKSYEPPMLTKQLKVSSARDPGVRIRLEYWHMTSDSLLTQKQLVPASCCHHEGIKSDMVGLSLVRMHRSSHGGWHKSIMPVPFHNASGAKLPDTGVMPAPEGIRVRV